MNSALLQRTIMFVIGIAVGLVLLFAATHAPAKNYAQVVCDSEPDPERCQQIHFWFLSARSNERTSCCGIGDAYWADQVDKVDDKGITVTITDRRDCEYDNIKPRVEEDADGNYNTVYDGQPCITGRTLRDGQQWFVPNEAIDKRMQGNPTGHVIIFISGSARQNMQGYGVICFFPGGGF